jgi:hypothetical protein
MSAVHSWRRWIGIRRRPTMSFVVAVYNMRREAPRTLRSLSPDYQRGASPKDYEVIVVDNGSSEPLDPGTVESLGAQFRMVRMPGATSSPAPAMNLGVRHSRGRYVALMIDGARMLTPGVVRELLRGVRLADDPIVSVPGWHLGPDLQYRSARRGYDRQTEDSLLDSIGWPQDGYRLSEIAVPAGSCKDGVFVPLSESNCLALRRETFDALGGFDERFDTPGGGLVNPDLYKRACLRPGTELIVVLGEGTFHQFHGGVATNAPAHEQTTADFRRQYEQLRGEKWERASMPATFLGALPRQALPFIAFSAELAAGRSPPGYAKYAGLRLGADNSLHACAAR